METKNLPKKVRPLAYWGWEYIRDEGKSLLGLCPFCGDETLAINPENGKWVCQHANRCGHQGNIFSFLKQYWEMCHESTGEDDLQNLADWRGIPIRYFKKYGWALDPASGRYLLPIRNSTGSIIDLRNVRLPSRGQKYPVKSTAGVDAGLLGWNRLISSPRTYPVFIQGGEWDTPAMDWMLDKAREKAVVVGLPGEKTFRVEWAEAMKGRVVYICLDNDRAGLEGMAKIGGCDGWPKEEAKLVQGLLRPYTREIYYIHWPDTLPEGFDTNDHVRTNGAGPKAYKAYMNMMAEFHPRQVSKKKKKATITVKGGVIKVTKKRGKAKSFESLVADFRRWKVLMTPEYRNALRLTLATVLSTPIEDEPVWLYVVGPPGSGKTAILESTQDSPLVHFESTLGVHSLVSGWNAGADPSIIPEIDGKCLVLKDMTEVLKMKPVDRDEVFGTLRGAFDGHVRKTYGNGVRREYDSKFSIVAGVTHIINGFTAKGAALGERFLKYTIRETRKANEDKVRAAIRGLGLGRERTDALGQEVAQFIDRRVDRAKPLPIPTWFEDKVVSLVSLISLLRTGVERDYRRSITYRPEAEVGTRLGRQLTKLAWGLCIVEDKKEIDEHVWELVRRVGVDTATGFNQDVVRGMMFRGGRNLLLDIVAEEVDLSKSSIREQLEDLVTLKLVSSKRSEVRLPGRLNGPPPTVWTVRKPVRRLWEEVHRAGP